MKNLKKFFFKKKKEFSSQLDYSATINYSPKSWHLFHAMEDTSSQNAHAGDRSRAIFSKMDRSILDVGHLRFRSVGDIKVGLEKCVERCEWLAPFLLRGICPLTMVMGVKFRKSLLVPKSTRLTRERWQILVYDGQGDDQLV